MCLFNFDGSIIPNLLQFLAYFVWPNFGAFFISITSSLPSTKMRQDKIFARILLIFSIANVAIAAPAAVRQRHLDVAKAASEKRASGSGDGETSDLQPDSSPGITPHENPTDDWAWFHRLSSQPDVPESSSAVANRIATQSSGESGLGDGAAGGSLPESGSHKPPQNIPWSSLEITQATPSSSSDSAHSGELDPLVPHQGYSLKADLIDKFTSRVAYAAGGLALVAGTLAIGYAIHKRIKHHPYVSHLSPVDI